MKHLRYGWLSRDPNHLSDPLYYLWEWLYGLRYWRARGLEP